MLLKEITDRDRAVIECQIMKLDLPKALAYMEKSGFPCKRTSYYTRLANLKKATRDRLMLIAAETFEKQHLERIDELLLIKKEMWANYENETGPYKRVMILKEIKDIQRFISSYYEATQDFTKDKSGIDK